MSDETKLTPEVQLERWVAGESLCPNTRNECCPDFSCCRPELLAPKVEREAFAAAHGRTREHMLGGFLSEAISTYKPDAKVHIAGMAPEDGKEH